MGTGNEITKNETQLKHEFLTEDEMAAREQLLNALSEAVVVIRRLADIQRRLNQVENQHRAFIPHKSFIVKDIIKNSGAFIKIILAAVALFALPVTVGILVFGSPVWIAMYFYYKSENRKIDVQNQQNAVFNEQLKQKKQAILEDLKPVQLQYKDLVARWYPIDYCSVDAVEFFYSAVKNYRTSDLTELINMYEKTAHQRRVESNQETMIEQMNLNILLTQEIRDLQRATLFENMRHHAAQESAMRQANSSLNSINRHLDGIRRGY